MCAGLMSKGSYKAIDDQSQAHEAPENEGFASCVVAS